MPEEVTIEIPDIVDELIQPVPGDSPTGIEVENDEDYFKLSMEIGKPKPDYKICVELAETILKEKSKDMWTAGWIAFSWYRIEKVQGVLNGMILILNLLKNFREKLYPENVVHRSKAVQFLNSPRFTKLFEREKIDPSNSDTVIKISEVFLELKALSAEVFGENAPVLKVMEEVIGKHKETASDFSKEKPKQVEEPVQPVITEEKPVEVEQPAEKKEPEWQSVEPVEKTISQPQVPKTQSVAGGIQGEISSEKDALGNIRKIVTFYFEEEKDGTKETKVPKDSYVYGISRTVQWGRIIIPVDKDGLTQIEAPNQIMITKIKELYSAKDWETLIPRIELNFIKTENSLVYWFDAQKYLVEALEDKGGSFAAAADEIKISLARLVTRYPKLSKMKFKGGVPFAEDETQNWIEKEVKSSLSGGKSGGSVILPPIMGDDYSSITEEYKKACEEIDSNFEENLSKLQKSILGETRKKGKFLRLLNVANYCVSAERFDLANIFLDQLTQMIQDYHIEEWEDALCVSVWQSSYLTNQNLLESESDPARKEMIINNQKDIFKKIARYDGVLAMKISNLKNNGGE